MNCSIQGCDRPVFIKKRGLCRQCYQRAYRATGGFAPGGRPESPFAAERARRQAERLREKAAQIEAMNAELRAAEEALRVAQESKITAAQSRLAKAQAWHERMKLGESMSDIARAEGVTRARIHQVLLATGFPTRVAKPINPRALCVMTPRSRALVRIVSTLDQNIQVGKRDECWPWTGPSYDPTQGKCSHIRYGKIFAFDPLDSDTARKTTVHRVVHLLYKGPIPEGMTVDHICFNTLCCNPSHLQVLTNSENSARKDPDRMARNISEGRMGRKKREAKAG